MKDVKIKMESLIRTPTTPQNSSKVFKWASRSKRPGPVLAKAILSPASPLISLDGLTPDFITDGETELRQCM